MKNRPLLARFGFALAGLRFVWSRERSFRTECWCALAAALVVIVLRPGLTWAALIAVCVMVVLTLELMNSALEYLLDHIHPDLAPAIGHAKDAAAGAVLVASVGSSCIGLLMLLSVAMGW